MSGKMESLWSRMELPEADQKKFLSQYTGYSDFVIVKFKEEVRGYLQLSRTIISIVASITDDDEMHLM